MLKRKIAFAKKHIVLISIIHFVGGFGLALILQFYLSGSAFLPVHLGWLLLAIAIIGHIYVLSQ